MPRPRLVETMLDADNASTRARAFERGAALQPEYDSFSWLKTALLATPRARGLRAFAWPWLCINGVSVLWTSLYELALPKRTSSLGSLRHRVPAGVLDDGISVGFSVEPSGGAVLGLPNGVREL